MADFTEDHQRMRPEDELYDRNYYENYNGEAYGRSKQWLEFFGAISSNVIESLRPTTVLDAGCAYGLLVETLRDQGVEAFGIDVSEFAISQARSDIKKYLSVHSLLEPFERHYDLIVSIEVIEHIKEEDSDTAIQNMCNAADRILLATTPDDFDDPTHFNVNPPIYWIKKFSKYGFEPEINYHAGFLTPYAMLFRKCEGAAKSQVHALFGEKKLQDFDYSRVVHERNLQKSEIAILKKNIDRKEALAKDLQATIADSQTHISNLEDVVEVEKKARVYYQSVVERYHSSIFWKLGKPVRILMRLFAALRPILPRLLANSAGTPRASCSADLLGSWGLIHAEMANDENFVFNLTANMGKSSERISAVPIVGEGSDRLWVFKKMVDAVGYEVEIPSIKIMQISIFRVSPVYAWTKLLLYRWRIGKGGGAALRFGLRLLKFAVLSNSSGMLDEIWPTPSKPDQDYEAWVKRFDCQGVHEFVKDWIDALQYKPLISIILPTYNSNKAFLSAAVQSVIGQSYQHWQLCIADDASSDEDVREWIKELDKNDRIEIIFRDSNGHISAASNSALKLAKGEFITFLDHDDQLHPHALAAVVDKLNQESDLDMIYSDEDKIDSWGYRSEPHFKPDWSPDLLLSQNYVCHLAVYRRSLLQHVGGFREGYEGAQDYDLVLRITEKTERIGHIPHVLYHWRMAEGSTALDSNQKDYAHGRAELVLREALQRRRLSAEVLPSGIGSFHRIRYDIPFPQPLVSIIIPTRDHAELLENCVDGIINNTNYANWEILIIDNGSTAPTTLEYFDKISSDDISIHSFPGEFNYSAINNFGVKQARGDIILLLNNDVEVIDPSWLGELVSHAIRPEIGAVGARLYYPDDYVQHDGILVGIGGVAGYANPRLARSGVAEFGGSRIIRNFSAVTAAALAVRKEVFIEVGGLDEINLAVAFNDVDFCLRVQEAGYRNIYSPYAELYHYESISRGPDVGSEKAARFEKEALYMKDKWDKLIDNDPCYNPNLSLTHGFALDMDRGQTWPWQNR